MHTNLLVGARFETPTPTLHHPFGLFGSTFFKIFFENLVVGRIWLWRESKYRGDFMRRKIKEFMGFRMSKVMVSYYRIDSVDSIFTFILDGFD